MSTKRESADRRNRWAPIAIVVAIAFATVAWLAPVAAGHPTGAVVRPAAPTPLVTYIVHSKSYPGTYAVNGLASNKTTALLDNLLANFTNQLVLFNGPLNTSKVIQKFVPGGSATALISVISAGGAFFIAWLNTTTGSEFWYKVTLSGVVSTVTLPIGAKLTWSFVYGNGTALFAAAGNRLVKINPATLALAHNYTKSISSKIIVGAVLPVGNRIYIGGSRVLTNGAANPYFGFLNTTSGVVTNVSKVISTYPATLSGEFLTLILHGTNVYAGGFLGFVNATGAFSTVGGYFYKFVPSTSAFKNLSALDPNKHWGLWALEPWATTIGLSFSGYTFNATGLGNLGGSIDTLSSTGTSLVNVTSVFPKGYLAFIFQVTSASSGWFFSGGFKSAGGIGEAVAVKT